MDLDELLKNCQVLGIIGPKKHNKKSIEIPSTKLSRPVNSRIIQNFILVWLCSAKDEMDDEDFHNSITELQRVVNTVETFTDTYRCIDFLTEIKHEKSFMIISHEVGKDIVPLVHDIIQLNSIYIFSKTIFQDKQWLKQWPKVQNMFSAIQPICQALRQDAHKCDQDLVSISFVSRNDNISKQNLDQLDPTFMYTQILKEILLTIEFDEEHIKDFTKYYRENFADNAIQLNSINKFETDYSHHPPVWWYTHECCFYSVLNRSLRLMEIDTIIKMGFFIRDLHRQIAQLHSKQFSTNHQSEPFTIYRGQGMLKADFDKMLEIQGGLISFNSFLSTSKDLSIANEFAHSTLANPDSVGIIFVISIDPSIKSTPFAIIDDDSYYRTEEEILFSMHTIFRIDNMIPTSNDNRLWQVDLVQTNDKDPELNALTERIRAEIQGSTEWDKLGKLLMKLGQYSKADELYEVLIDQTHNDRQKIQFYHQLGWSKKNQNKYEEAIAYYEKSLEIKEKVLPENHPSFIVFYNDIGSVYEKMNEYSKALLYYEAGLKIQSETESSNYYILANSCSKIGSIYEKLEDYQKAIEFHELAVKLRQKLTSDKYQTAYSYNNIGSVYEKMGEYDKALSSHQKALELQQKLLPPNHPDMGQSYSNIGYVYSKMGQYTTAHRYNQLAVDIGQRSLPVNHPRLQQWKKKLEYTKRKCH